MIAARQGDGWSSQHMLAYASEREEKFLEAKTDKEDYSLTPECVECGRKNTSSKGGFGG